MLLKVENENQIVRDSRNSALLCVDTSLLRKHEKFERERAREHANRERINSLEAQIDELRAMIRSLATRDNN